MRGRKLTVGAALALVAALAGTGAPASAADPTTVVNIQTVTRGTTDLAISGKVVLGTDATGPITVSTDAPGDASPAGAGLDLGDTTFSITTGSSNPKLIVETKLHDGNTTAGGSVPFTGFSFPFVVDGDSTPSLWLGGGGAGTNFPPSASSWVTLCNTATGWTCPGSLGGAVTLGSIRWELPFNSATPKIKPGVLIDPGGSNGGVPSSFAWPSAYILAATSPADRAASMTPYLVPGSVEIAVAPVGTPEWKLIFSPATVSVSTGSYIGSLAAPTVPGTYTVFARSCWGSADMPTCVTTTRDQTM